MIEGLKTGIIIQARMDSTRLPGKVLMDINGKPMLSRVIERLKKVKCVDEIIVATTNRVIDDQILELALKENVSCYRGAPYDVLSRYYESAKQFNITYNRGKQYRPDFVVETEDQYYLVEVKRKDEMDNPDVIAKKERAMSYCKIASDYNQAQKRKPFTYLFIPHDEISQSTSFIRLRDRFSQK
jgi:CTP:phosphocholine cytidylyltransferase-like protein